MQEIRYRVQDLKGNWYFLDTEVADGIETKKDTLCRCTGVRDVTGQLIYEKDILSIQNNGDATKPKLREVRYIPHLLGFCITDADYLKKGTLPDKWERVDADTLSTMLVVGNIIDDKEAADSAPAEMTKTIYKLTADVYVHDESFRHVELYFDKESQALKVSDRFKEHYHKIGFKTAVNIVEVTLFLNANGYHGV